MRHVSFLVLLAFVVAVAQAGPITFDLTWSGAEFSNTATATGQITFEESLLPNPANYGGPMPSWVLGLTITVTGARSGNGLYTRSDFSGFIFNTGGVALDLTRELVGQPTASSTWGTRDGNGGDFNLIGGAGLSATTLFTVAVGGSKSLGDYMLLTSFAPASAIPEPGMFGMVGAGLLALYAGLRRRSA